MFELGTVIWSATSPFLQGLLDYVNAIAALAAVLLIYAQIRSAVRWNRLQTTHSTLREVVVGQFSDLVKNLAVKYEWDIIREYKPYDEALKAVSRRNDASSAELAADVQSLLRILETVCISVDRGIVEEKVCKEYLFSMFQAIYRNTAVFIAEERRVRREPRVFEHFEKYAVRWGAKRAA